MNARSNEDPAAPVRPPVRSRDTNHGRIVSIPEQDRCLDSAQLGRLEQSFRQWADASPRADIRLSRRRILILFLLIRYTGAKLNEVLAMNPFQDIDAQGRTILFGNADGGSAVHPREVQISEILALEIQKALTDPMLGDAVQNLGKVDPGFVRRKFYERARACGISKRLGGPEMIRKARAVELMQGNLPLPAVQKMLGHSTPNLTSAYVSFSVEEMQQVTRLFIEREASRRTSARNSFFGKIQTIRKGDIQTRVTLTTLSGYCVTTVITNDSLDRMALKKGRLITAEVKAPWVILHKGESEPQCSAENRFNGMVERINQGRVNSEFTLRLADGTALCAVVATESVWRLALSPGDRAWALFNGFAVVLHVD